MTDKHLSTQFDSELNAISARVMELGGLVESQIRQAIHDARRERIQLAVELGGKVLVYHVVLPLVSRVSRSGR